jgi:hypothetical protein
MTFREGEMKRAAPLESKVPGAKRLCQNSEIPPTGVGGWFKSGLQTTITEF